MDISAGQGQQRIDPDFSDIKIDSDGKIFPSNWKWDSSSVGSMKKILLSLARGPFNDKIKDDIRIMDDKNVVDSFIRRYPELLVAYYPSNLRDIERALQLNWETFDSQFDSILGKIKSSEIEEQSKRNASLALAGAGVTQQAQAAQQTLPNVSQPVQVQQPTLAPVLEQVPIEQAPVEPIPTEPTPISTEQQAESLELSNENDKDKKEGGVVAGSSLPLNVL